MCWLCEKFLEREQQKPPEVPGRLFGSGANSGRQGVRLGSAWLSFRYQSAVFQITHKARLVNGVDGCDAHRDCGEFPRGWADQNVSATRVRPFGHHADCHSCPAGSGPCCPYSFLFLPGCLRLRMARCRIPELIRLYINSGGLKSGDNFQRSR